MTRPTCDIPRRARRWAALPACAAALLVAAGGRAAEAEPSWGQAMVAARRAVLAAKDPGGFKPWQSAVLRSGQEEQEVSVDIRGVQTLCLRVDGGRHRDNRAVWASPRLIDAAGTATPLTGLEPTWVSVGLGRLSAIDGSTERKLHIGDKVFDRGLWAFAPTVIIYKLDRPQVRFEASVGIDSRVRRGRGSVRFGVKAGRDAAYVLQWAQIRKRYPREAQLMAGREAQWFASDGNARIETDLIQSRLKALAPGGKELARRFDELRKASAPPTDPRWLDLLVEADRAVQRQTETIATLDAVNVPAALRAARDLTKTFPRRYARGGQYVERLEAFAAAIPRIRAGLKADSPDAIRQLGELLALRREALLANPLLDFDKLLVVRRRGDLGLPANWVGNCSMRPTGYDNEIAVLSPVRPDGKLTPLYRPPGGGFVGDVDLHWDADKLLFSAPGRNGRWQVQEIRIDGAGLRELTRGKIREADNYDPCYLPDGGVMFVSSAVCQGVPCVGGGNPVANLFRMDAGGGSVRQLCFDQDHNWYPTVLADGQVMYARWEYTDTPHYFTRLLFRMNPDGTGQTAMYGSNSYWPNSLFYARPIPGRPSRIVGVVSGHHGERRMGELVLLDTSRGRHEAGGVLQRIPGFGKTVQARIRDQLVGGVWPRFLHPWPLSGPSTSLGAGNYFLVSMQPNSRAGWGIYLVDVFDNLTLVHELPGHALLEPVPLRKRPRPPIIPPRVDTARKDATVYLTDVYKGPGLAGVPRGTVKKLRLFEWHYAYNRMGGHIHVAVEGGWEPKRILGTVPIEADGSAMFTVPANTPIAVQPLDEKGQALQLMRSWFTAMPGETLSCVGCHESQSDAPPNARTLAARRPPRKIAPWYGPTRGFSFPRDVQPALNKYCVSCHDGRQRPPGKQIPDLADTSRGWSGFTKSYLALHPYVRRPGPESDYHLLTPADYRANTSELIQMLRKGHHNVRLDAEAWDRLITWIDLNVPDHGTWTEHAGAARVEPIRRLRAQYRKLYANIDVDPEAIPVLNLPAVKPVMPAPLKRPPARKISCPNWPLDATEAKDRQAAAAESRKIADEIDLGKGVKMKLTLVPAGSFVMGSTTGDLDELPRAVVKIDRPFWIGTCEVTNRQFGRFDPTHDSRYIDQQWKDHTGPGYPANRPDQPVIRVSWQQAMAFCNWLSRKTGRPFTLPTEAQWEYAARAGSPGPFFYGGLDDDFSNCANVADLSIAKLAVVGVNPRPVRNPSPYMAFVPRDGRFDDGQHVVSDTGKYQPNPWGLHDVHGNVAEWTRTVYRPYPYREDGRSDPGAGGEKVVRGGSWRDRPKRCTNSYRLYYPAWQKLTLTGFRVACPVDKP